MTYAHKTVCPRAIQRGIMMTMRALIILGVVIFSFIYGGFVGAQHYPPYGIMETVYRHTLKNYDQQETIDELYWETDVEALITINTEQDVDDRREQLIQSIWKQDVMPSVTPNWIEYGVKDDDWQLKNLHSIDKLTVIMEHDITSIAYLFHPIKSNNNLIIYHQGHTGGFIMGKKQIQIFLNNGYDVVAFAMPLTGMNNKPIIQTRYGVMRLTEHENLAILVNDTFNPIKLFMQPINSVLNHINTSYKNVIMTGISGGGWTTTLYSALDKRITHSYPIAGTLPIYLRSRINTEPSDWLDWEHTTPEIYTIANYLELYLLGSSQGRKQTQILNKFDNCCFSGIKHQTYEQHISKKAEQLNGKFSVLLDDTHKKHQISDHAMQNIMEMR